MATTTSVIASARAECDQTGSDQGGTDAEMTVWLGEDYPMIVRQIIDIDPARYQTIEYCTIATNNYVNLVAATAHSVITQVGKETYAGSGIFKTIPPADQMFQFDAPRLSWVQGRNFVNASLNVWPASQSLGNYICWYTPAATLPASPSTALDLPPGFDKILVQELCCHIRRRLDQSVEPHVAEIERLWKAMKPSLTDYHRTPQAISDYDDSDY